MEQLNSTPDRFSRKFKLSAALLSGGLIVGNVLAGAQAAAETLPSPAPANTMPHVEQTFAVQQYIGEQQAVTSVQLLAQHAMHVVHIARHSPHHTSTNSDELYIEWSKVATCEEGGWQGASGYAFPDSLGITRQNWLANGGGSDTSPATQIEVGERIVHRYGIPIPDQNGCQPGGW